MTDILTPEDFGNRITDAERGHLGPADFEHLRKHDAALRDKVDKLTKANNVLRETLMRISTPLDRVLAGIEIETRRVCMPNVDLDVLDSHEALRAELAKVTKERDDLVKLAAGHKAMADHYAEQHVALMGAKMKAEAERDEALAKASHAWEEGRPHGDEHGRTEERAKTLAHLERRKSAAEADMAKISTDAGRALLATVIGTITKLHRELSAGEHDKDGGS
jgi:hypothetical protein